MGQWTIFREENEASCDAYVGSFPLGKMGQWTSLRRANEGPCAAYVGSCVVRVVATRQPLGPQNGFVQLTQITKFLLPSSCLGPILKSNPGPRLYLMRDTAAKIPDTSWGPGGCALYARGHTSANLH